VNKLSVSLSVLMIPVGTSVEGPKTEIWGRAKCFLYFFTIFTFLYCSFIVLSLSLPVVLRPNAGHDLFIREVS